MHNLSLSENIKHTIWFQSEWIYGVLLQTRLMKYAAKITFCFVNIEKKNTLENLYTLC